MAVNPEDVPDVVFRGNSATGTWTELATDDSGVGTNLTSNTNSAYETSSARANLTTRRTIDIRCEMDDGSIGTLFTWDKGGGNITRIEHIGLGTINIIVDGVTEFAFGPNLTPSTPEEVLLTWTMEPHVDKLGSQDAIRHEIHFFNIDQGTYELYDFTLPEELADATGTLVWGANDTSDTNFYPDDILEVRLSSGFHTSTESYETFVSQSSAPTLEGNEYAPISMPTRTEAEIGNDGHFAGPVLILGAKAAEQHRGLLYSPIVNLVDNRNVLDLTRADFRYELPSGIRVRMEWSFYRPVPLGVTHVIPYLFVQHDKGAAADDMELEVSSSNSPVPTVVPDGANAIYTRYFTSTTISADHGTGDTAGEYVELSKLRVALDNRGRSYFNVGVEIDSVNLSSARIKAIALDPIVDLAGAGLGLGGLNG